MIEIARKSGWSGFWFRGLLPGIKLELEHDDWCERYIEQARSRYSKLFEPGMPLSEDGKNQTMPGEHSDLADILLEAIYAK